MKFRRILAALLALLMVASVTGCAISAALEEEGGFKFNSTQVSSEVSSDVKLHNMPAAPSIFGGIAAPSIFSDHTEKPYGIVEGDIYVSVDGSDETGDGSKEKPYASLEKARDVIRGMKAEGKLPAGGLTVSIMAGEYRLTDGIEFTEEDSGTKECPITYAAYGDGEVIFKGSMGLNASDFTAVGDDIKAILPDESKDQVMMVDLKKYGVTADQLHIYAIGQENFTSDYDPSYVGVNVQFYFNRQAFTLARWPNQGELLTVKQLISPGDRMTKEPAVLQLDRATMERVKGWHNTTNEIWIAGRFYVDYSTMSSNVTFDFDNSTAALNLACTHNYFDPSPYHFFNVLDELDIPGEWYLDRENCILYMYPTDDMSSAELEIVIDYDPYAIISGVGVNYVTFKGLNFMGTKGNGIYFNESDNIHVNRCNFYGIGYDYAAKLRGDNCSITECEAHYLLMHGFSVVGGEKETLKHANSILENCYVTNWGITFLTYAYALSIGGYGTTMRHCEAAYSVSNCAEVSQAENICEYNIFHDCTTWATDCGSLYNGSSVMSCVNTEFRYNIFYNMGSEWGKTSAIFWDDGHGGQRAYGNLFVNMVGYGITVGGGPNNTILNNIIINTGRDPIYYDQRPFDGYHRDGQYQSGAFYDIGDGYMWGNYKGVPRNSAWFEALPQLHDVIDDTSDLYAPYFLYNPSMSLVANNVVVDDFGKVGTFFFQTRTYSTVRDNYYGRFDMLDSIFVDPDNGDYRIREDAPIFEAMDEFKDIPYHLIGRY